jgi:hypothetical protein
VSAREPAKVTRNRGATAAEVLSKATLTLLLPMFVKSAECGLDVGSLSRSAGIQANGGCGLSVPCECERAGGAGSVCENGDLSVVKIFRSKCSGIGQIIRHCSAVHRFCHENSACRGG